jgi:hypothetical protein
MTMSGEARAAATSGKGGFLARQLNKLRFNELSEAFFARVILAKCSDPTSKEIIHVQLSLSDLFRTCKPGELEIKLAGVTFTTSDKITELTADFINAMLGSDLGAHSTTSAAAEYYHNHIASRLKWLKAGARNRWISRLDQLLGGGKAFSAKGFSRYRHPDDD